MTSTFTLTRKSLHRLISEALAAVGKPVTMINRPAPDGRLAYVIDGEILSAGETADRLGIQWPR